MAGIRLLIGYQNELDADRLLCLPPGKGGQWPPLPNFELGFVCCTLALVDVGAVLEVLSPGQSSLFLGKRKAEAQLRQRSPMDPAAWMPVFVCPSF